MSMKTNEIVLQVVDFSLAVEKARYGDCDMIL